MVVALQASEEVVAVAVGHDAKNSDLNPFVDWEVGNPPDFSLFDCFVLKFYSCHCFVEVAMVPLALEMVAAAALIDFEAYQVD